MGHAAPLGLFHLCGFAINMPLLTELIIGAKLLQPFGTQASF